MSQDKKETACGTKKLPKRCGILAILLNGEPPYESKFIKTFIFKLFLVSSYIKRQNRVTFTMETRTTSYPQINKMFGQYLLVFSVL